MTEHTERDDTEDSPKSRPPGYVAAEGRTVSQPAPTPARQFADFINKRVGRTR